MMKCMQKVSNRVYYLIPDMINFKITSNINQLNLLFEKDLEINQKTNNLLIELIKDDIISKTPVKSGKLKGSFQTNVSKGIASIWTDLFYAPYVNYGTQPHKISASKSLALHWNDLFFKSVEHPGQKANPFFLDESGNINNSTKEITQKTLNELTYEDIFGQ